LYVLYGNICLIRRKNAINSSLVKWRIEQLESINKRLVELPCAPRFERVSRKIFYKN
jgi:hypothetical protein